MTQNVIDPQDAHVLIVEDNLQNMILISRLLDFLKVARYEWKSSGWEMFDAIEAMGHVDLILMDLHLPQENGFELLAKIRKDPDLAETPVIAVTADANPQTMEETKRAGFNGFLGKPINPEKFTKQIAAILRGDDVWDLGFV